MLSANETPEVAFVPWNSREFFGGASPDAIAARLKAGAPVDETDVDDRTPLHHAAVHGYRLAVHLLLAAGAGIADDRYGWTPLHCAAACDGRPYAIAPLLAAGADPGARTDRGITPLHFAAMHGTPESVRELLAAGADPDARDRAGHGPAWRAWEAGHAAALAMIEAAGGRLIDR